MKRSKKPLTFAAVAASIGALSMAVEGCVYGPPPPTHENNVYGPPPETAIEETDESTKETQKTQATKPANSETEPEICVYGPPPDDIDGPEEDVYGPPPED